MAPLAPRARRPPASHRLPSHRLRGSGRGGSSPLSPPAFASPPAAALRPWALARVVFLPGLFGAGLPSSSAGAASGAGVLLFSLTSAGWLRPRPLPPVGSAAWGRRRPFPAPRAAAGRGALASRPCCPALWGAGVIRSGRRSAKGFPACAGAGRGAGSPSGRPPPSPPSD